MSKLTKNQKAFLKTIKNDKAKAEQKTQFKLQNKFDRKGVDIIFTDGQFKTDDPRVIEFLNLTPMFCNKVDKTLTKDNFVSKIDENGKIILGEKQNKSVIDEVNKTITFTCGTIYDMSKFKQDKIDNPKPKAGWLLPNCDIVFESFEEVMKHREKLMKGKTLTPEALRDLTEPKVVETAQVEKPKETTETPKEEKLTQESFAKKIVADKLESMKKPPLGLKPKYIHDEQRLKEITDAMSRYSIENKNIPSEWIEEKYQLDKNINSRKTNDAPKEFCVEITKENKEVLSKVWGNFFNTIQNCTVGSFLHTNSLFSYCTQSNSKYPIHDYTRSVFAKVVSTEEFLTNIGREDLIKYDAEKVITNQDEPKQYKGFALDPLFPILDEAGQWRGSKEDYSKIWNATPQSVKEATLRNETIEWNDVVPKKISDFPKKSLIVEKDYVIGMRSNNNFTLGEIAEKVVEMYLKKIDDLRQTPLTPDECIKPTETVEPKTRETESDKAHLHWIYERLILHDENPNVDYMLRLKKIIDNW